MNWKGRAMVSLKYSAVWFHASVVILPDVPIKISFVGTSSQGARSWIHFVLAQTPSTCWLAPQLSSFWNSGPAQRLMLRGWAVSKATESLSLSTVLISQRESKHAMPLCTTHISWHEFFVNTHCPPLKAGCHETLFLSKLQQRLMPLMRCSWRPFTDTKRSPARTPACIWSRWTFDPNNIKGCLLPWKSVVFSSEVFSSDVLIQKEALSSFCQFYQP